MRTESPTGRSRHGAVLIVDDEPGLRAALSEHFTRHGWRATRAAGIAEAQLRLAQDPFDLVVSDMRMPDGDGLDLLRAVRQLAPSAAVILLTAFGTVPDAVTAMRLGAGDYLMKPVVWEHLEAAALRLTRQSAPGRGHVAGRADGIVGRSARLLQALSRARAAAATDADVLVEAESGTGKELLARMIHESSSRAAGPFIALNCAAVPEQLLESELFGHARGAFTGAAQARAGRFELAHGGTLLLDEIGEMPLSLQPKLLRVLQEREVERLGETRATRVDTGATVHRRTMTTAMHATDAQIDDPETPEVPAQERHAAGGAAQRMPWLPCTLALDVPLTRFTVRDLLSLRPGSLVETACHQSSDIPMRVNGLLMAWAEFEVLGERLAARITDLA